VFNLPIRSQILIGMLVVFLTTTVVGVVAYQTVRSMADTSSSIYDSVAAPLMDYDASGGTSNAEELLNKVDVSNAEALLESNKSKADQAFIITGVITGAGLILSILLAFMISGAIRRPILELTDAAEKISKEKTPFEVGFSGENELSNLTKAFNKLVHELKGSQSASNALGTKASEAAVQEERLRQEIAEEKQRLASRLDQVVAALHRLSDGDLTVRLDTVDDATLSGLFTGFNQVVSKMNNTIVGIQRAVDGTSSMVEEIRMKSSGLSNSSSQISGQTTDVAAATEEMAMSIVDNARNASATADVSENIGEVAKRGKGVVEQTITKINEIASAVEESSKVVQLLSKSSEQIGDIVRVIDEIADQTNLLALNAAIEAARAGELGKGFAVVADEVRKLAERTSVATQEISEKIKRVQSDTVNAVEAMNTGTAKVKEGIGLAQEAGGALDEVVTSAANGAEMVLQIAAAVEEQSATSASISKSIELVSEAVNHSGLNIEAINGEVENLARSTSGISKLLGGFSVTSTMTGTLPSREIVEV